MQLGVVATCLLLATLCHVSHSMYVDRKWTRSKLRRSKLAALRSLFTDDLMPMGYPPLPENKRSNANEAEKRVPMLPFDKRVPMLPFDKRVPMLPFDKRVPMLPFDKRVPMLPFDKRVPALPFDKRLPLLPFDKRVPQLPPDRDEKRLPMLPPDKKDNTLTEEDKRVPMLPWDKRAPLLPPDKRLSDEEMEQLENLLANENETTDDVRSHVEDLLMELLKEEQENKE